MLTKILHKLASNPFVYNLIQKAAGEARFNRFVSKYLSDLKAQTILDLGAGTGALLELIPMGNTYIWMDMDWEKLRGFKARELPGLAVLGDASRVGLKDKSVDVTVNIALSHHLTDSQFHDYLLELKRVTSKKMIFVDAVRSNRWLGSLLWKYDQGSHPRSQAAILEALRGSFDITVIENLTIYHEYLLCIGAPKA